MCICIKQYGLYGYNKKKIQSSGDIKVNVIEKEALDVCAFILFYIRLQCVPYTRVTY